MATSQKLFKVWLREVDKEVYKRIEWRLDDLSATALWDMWTDQMAPADAAEEAIMNDDVASGVYSEYGSVENVEN